MKRENNRDRIILAVFITLAIGTVAYTKKPPKKIYDVLIDGTSKTVVQAYDQRTTHAKGERVIVRRRSKKDLTQCEYFFASTAQLKHLEIDSKKYSIAVIQDTAVLAYTGTILKNH